MNCIKRFKQYTFKTNDGYVDRSAVDFKFNEELRNEDEAGYYYRPLIHEFIDKSDVEVIYPGLKPDAGISPYLMHAIVSGGWDDEYLFEFRNIEAPKATEKCEIVKALFSGTFISTKAEKEFLTLWMLSVFELKNRQIKTGNLYLTDEDFVL